MHGWRAFLGEVGIIVIGVLIALGLSRPSKLCIGEAKSQMPSRR